MEMKLEEGLASKLKVPKGKRDLMVFDTETPGFFLAEVLDRPGGLRRQIQRQRHAAEGHALRRHHQGRARQGAQGGGRREGPGAARN